MELDSVKAKEPKKPDFMINPHKYFRDKNAPTLLEFKAAPKAITESKQSFYELNFFVNQSIFILFIIYRKIYAMLLMKRVYFQNLANKKGSKPHTFTKYIFNTKINF